MFGFPIASILLAFCWIYLTRFAFTFKQIEFPGGLKEIKRLKTELGPLSYEERLVGVVFLLAAFSWISRSFILQPFFPAIDDTIIAITFGLLLFILPNANKKEALIRWDDTLKLPWGIILLFGGGMALAKAFDVSGLAEWLGNLMTSFGSLPLILLLLLLVTAVNFLTEITSNLATTAMLLPVLAPLALEVGVHPFGLMVGAAIAASCAFMLPVATPPNAVVFGSGYLKIPDMVSKGIILNIFSIFLITVMVYLILPIFWGIDLFTFPELFLS